MVKTTKKIRKFEIPIKSLSIAVAKRAKRVKTVELKVVKKVKKRGK